MRAGSHLINVEELTGHGWRLVGYELTDSGGRAMWTVPRGTHRYRATLSAAGDLAGATTKPVVVRGS